MVAGLLIGKGKSGRIRPSGSGSVYIERAKLYFFDKAIIRDHLVGSTYTGIMSTAAYIQKIAINSMKRGTIGKRGKRKGKLLHSLPGKPPKYWKGLIRRFLWFAYDPRSESAVIGPILLGRSTVVRDLEVGAEWKGLKARPTTAPAFEKGKYRLMNRIQRAAARKALKGRP